MTDQLVSVVIPVYQRSYCVMDAVQSVLEQSHAALDCVVVDDGSTDGSLDLVIAACGDDARVRTFTQTHGECPRLATGGSGKLGVSS